MCAEFSGESQSRQIGELQPAVVLAPDAEHEHCLPPLRSTGPDSSGDDERACGARACANDREYLAPSEAARVRDRDAQLSLAIGQVAASFSVEGPPSFFMIHSMAGLG